MTFCGDAAVEHLSSATMQGMLLTVLRICFLQATIAGGGVIPHIHKSLINKGTKKEGPGVPMPM